MPLLKNKPFALAKAPEDLKPEEKVWMVRFTDEVFRSYEEYLERINLYRQRVWKCKATGKMHLTFEEALVSEHQASEKSHKFPTEFMEYVLRLVQFSMLNLNDLVTMIYERLKEYFLEGEELHGRKEDGVCPCKILEIITSNGSCCYKLGWLDKSRKVISTSTEDPKTLIRKKLPFSRDLLKLFIKESTSQNDPWVVHHKLAMEHGISTEPPEEFREKEFKTNKAGSKRMAEMENANTPMSKKKKRNQNADQVQESSQVIQAESPKVVRIEYPIDDELVKPSEDDPIFSERPKPSRHFIIPMENVGDLLMVWDFCSSFAKVLHLSPFSLEDFENAIVYEGISDLILELHFAILKLLISDQGEYYALTQQKKRKEMIASTNWTEYLCDFVELEKGKNSTDHIKMIKRGQYYKLSICVKLEILRGLVNWALSTDAVKGTLEVYISEMRALVAAKREEDLEEVRKRREDKQLKEMTSDNDNSVQQNGVSECTSLHSFDSERSCEQTKDMQRDVNMETPASNETHHIGISGSKRDILASRRAMMKQALEAKIAMEKEKEASRLAELKKLREERHAREKEAKERKMKEQRQEKFDLEMEKRFIRTDALGKDRHHNRYWFFRREGRLFIESEDHKEWSFYASNEELDGLMGSLNPKGVRELNLQMQLQKHYSKICAAFQKRLKQMARSKEMSQNVVSDTPVLRRSVRVSVLPEDKKLPPFLGYVNKWK